MSDDMDEKSVPTNGATVSHRHRTRSMLSEATGSTGTGGAIQAEARPSLPPSQRTPTPPGVPSKRGSPAVTARRASLPITPISPSDSNPSLGSYSNTHYTTMYPFVRPLPTPPTMPASSAPHIPPPTMGFSPLSPISPSNLPRNAGYARPTTHKAPGMDTVPEHAGADASEYAETKSLRQLPSPPASPSDQPHVDARKRGSSVSSSRHPSRQSASNALPSSYRPRASTGPSVGLPLTAAFQTSVLRSGSGTSASPSVPPSSFGHGQRYPPIATSSPPPRSRPSSVSVSSVSSTTATVRASSSPSRPPDADESMTRSTEAFRRMSTTDIRHRHPLSSSSRPGSPNLEGQARVFLRTSDALRNLEVTSGSSSRPSSSHRHAAVYSPPPPTGVGIGGSATPPPPSSSSLPLSPTSSPPGASFAMTPVTASTAPRLTVHTHPRPPGMGSAHPSTINWKSLASGSRPSQASPHHQNPYPSAARSRSNSVRSVRTLPPHIPALEELSPITMASAEEDAEENFPGGKP